MSPVWPKCYKTTRCVGWCESYSLLLRLRRVVRCCWRDPADAALRPGRSRGSHLRLEQGTVYQSVTISPRERSVGEHGAGGYAAESLVDSVSIHGRLVAVAYRSGVTVLSKDGGENVLRRIRFTGLTSARFLPHL
jgi:hypothetical protein